MAAGIVLMWTWGEGGGEEVGGWGGPEPAGGHPSPPRPVHCLHTSTWASVSSSMMRACGVATTLCPLISMMRCPTRTPPRSAMPPRRRLQIWSGGGAAQGAAPGAASPLPAPPPTLVPGPHNAVLHTEAQLLTGMGPADDGCGDWRAVDDAQGHECLRLHLLCRDWGGAEGV